VIGRLGAGDGRVDEGLDDELPVVLADGLGEGACSPPAVPA
jgi:hypothetical protein